MTVSQFPAEILENTFEFLDRKSLDNCRLTCRYWKMVAEVKLRETVKIRNFFESVKSSRLKRMIKDSPHVADGIKHIDLTRDYGKRMPCTHISNCSFKGMTKTLECIYQSCRNIERITDMENTGIIMWSKILDVVDRGYLQKLQSLPMVPKRLSDISQYYAPIAWSLRSSLKKRDLRSNSLEFRNLLEGDSRTAWLHDFTALKELTVYFSETGIKILFSWDELFDLCSNHQSIRSLALLEAAPHAGDIYGFYPFRERDPCKNIKQLTIFLPNFFYEHAPVDYLIYKFPNLTKLCFNWSYPRFSHQEETFNLLADYISHINQVQIYYSYTRDVYDPEGFFMHLLKSCNMTKSMVELCALPEDCCWVQVDRSQFPPGSYRIRHFQRISDEDSY